MSREVQARYCDPPRGEIPRRRLDVTSTSAASVPANVSWHPWLRFLTTTLRLKVNESKSAVARPEERKILGFRNSLNGPERTVASLPKWCREVHGAEFGTSQSRTRGISLHRMIETLKPYLMGWRGFFGFCNDQHARAHEPGSVDTAEKAAIRICAGSGTMLTNDFKELRCR